MTSDATEMHHEGPHDDEPTPGGAAGLRLVPPALDQDPEVPAGRVLERADAPSRGVLASMTPPGLAGEVVALLDAVPATGEVRRARDGHRRAILPRAALAWRARGRHVRGELAEAGMATAEYAIATLAAVGFAGLLVVILQGSEVKGLLMGIIKRALSL